LSYKELMIVLSTEQRTGCWKDVSFFSFLGWGEAESTWYCGHYWPIVPAPVDRWWWLWRSRWNENWQEKRKYWEKTCPSATLFTTNPTWPDMDLNPSRRGGKRATNRLSYGTARWKDAEPGYRCKINVYSCCLTTLHTLLRLHSMEEPATKLFLIMNMEGCGREPLRSALKYHLGIHQEGLKRIT
jgi:hypothetical protein